MSKRLILLILVLVMAISMCATASAAEISDFGAAQSNVQLMQSPILDQEATASIQNLVSSFCRGQSGAFTIGSALTAYNADTDIVFYYLPVFCGGECVALVHMDTAGNMSITDDTRVYDAASCLPAGQYVLYVTGGIVYAESSEHTAVLADTGYSLSEDSAYRSMLYTDKLNCLLSKADTAASSSTFAPLSSAQKCISIDRLDVQSISAPNGVVPILENVECGITNFVSQGNYNLCWAACVATVVNFKKGYSLSAISVANALGHDYANPKYHGATIYETHSALSSYGLSNSISLAKMGWSKVKSNIRNDNPFLVFCNTYDDRYNEYYGHVLTGYGYQCASEDGENFIDQRYVHAWDPNGYVISWNYYSTYISTSGLKWVWEASIY